MSVLCLEHHFVICDIEAFLLRTSLDFPGCTYSQEAKAKETRAVVKVKAVKAVTEGIAVQSQRTCGTLLAGQHNFSTLQRYAVSGDFDITVMAGEHPGSCSW